MTTKLLKLTIEIKHPNIFAFFKIKSLINIFDNTFVIKYNMIIKNEINTNDKIQIIIENEFDGRDNIVNFIDTKLDKAYDNFKKI